MIILAKFYVLLLIAVAHLDSYLSFRSFRSGIVYFHHSIENFQRLLSSREGFVAPNKIVNKLRYVSTEDRAKILENLLSPSNSINLDLNPGDVKTLLMACIETKSLILLDNFLNFCNNNSLLNAELVYIGIYTSCNQNLWRSGVLIFEHAVKQMIVVDSYSFNNLIQKVIKAKKLSIACSLLERCHRSEFGQDVKTDIATYSLLVDYAGRIQDKTTISRSLKLIERSGRMKLSEETYLTALTIFAYSGDIKSSLEVFNQYSQACQNTIQFKAYSLVLATFIYSDQSQSLRNEKQNGTELQNTPYIADLDRIIATLIRSNLDLAETLGSLVLQYFCLRQDLIRAELYLTRLQHNSILPHVPALLDYSKLLQLSKDQKPLEAFYSYLKLNGFSRFTITSISPPTTQSRNYMTSNNTLDVDPIFQRRALLREKGVELMLEALCSSTIATSTNNNNKANKTSKTKSVATVPTATISVTSTIKIEHFVAVIKFCIADQQYDHVVKLFKLFYHALYSEMAMNDNAYDMTPPSSLPIDVPITATLAGTTTETSKINKNATCLTTVEMDCALCFSLVETLLLDVPYIIIKPYVHQIVSMINSLNASLYFSQKKRRKDLFVGSSKVTVETSSSKFNDENGMNEVSNYLLQTLVQIPFVPLTSSNSTSASSLTSSISDHSSIKLNVDNSNMSLDKISNLTELSTWYDDYAQDLYSLYTLSVSRLYRYYPAPVMSSVSSSKELKKTKDEIKNIATAVASSSSQQILTTKLPPLIAAKSKLSSSSLSASVGVNPILRAAAAVAAAAKTFEKQSTQNVMTGDNLTTINANINDAILSDNKYPSASTSASVSNSPENSKTEFSQYTHQQLEAPNEFSGIPADASWRCFRASVFLVLASILFEIEGLESSLATEQFHQFLLLNIYPEKSLIYAFLESILKLEPYSQTNRKNISSDNNKSKISSSSSSMYTNSSRHLAMDIIIQLRDKGFMLDDKIIFMLTRFMSQRIPFLVPVEDIIHLVKADNVKLSVSTQKEILIALNMACSSGTNIAFSSSSSGSSGNSKVHNMTYEFFEMIVEQADRDDRDIDERLWELFISSPAFKFYQTQSKIQQHQPLLSVDPSYSHGSDTVNSREENKPKVVSRQQSSAPIMSTTVTSGSSSTLLLQNSHGDNVRSTLHLSSFLSSRVMDILLGSRRSTEIKSLVTLLTAKSIQLDNEQFCIMLRKMMDKDNFAGAEELFSIILEQSTHDDRKSSSSGTNSSQKLSGQLLNLFALVFKKLNNEPGKQIRYLERISQHVSYCYQDMNPRAIAIYFKRACLLKLPVTAAIYFHAFSRIVDREGNNSMFIAKLCLEKYRPDILLRLIDGWTPRRTVLLSFVGTIIATLARSGFWKSALHFEPVYLGEMEKATYAAKKAGPWTLTFLLFAAAQGCQYTAAHRIFTTHFLAYPNTSTAAGTDEEVDLENNCSDDESATQQSPFIIPNCQRNQIPVLPSELDINLTLFAHIFMLQKYIRYNFWEHQQFQQTRTPQSSLTLQKYNFALSNRYINASAYEHVKNMKANMSTYADSFTQTMASAGVAVGVAGTATTRSSFTKPSIDVINEIEPIVNQTLHLMHIIKSQGFRVHRKIKYMDFTKAQYEKVQARAADLSDYLDGVVLQFQAQLQDILVTDDPMPNSFEQLFYFPATDTLNNAEDAQTVNNVAATNDSVNNTFSPDHVTSKVSSSINSKVVSNTNNVTTILKANATLQKEIILEKMQANVYFNVVNLYDYKLMDGDFPTIKGTANDFDKIKSILNSPYGASTFFNNTLLSSADTLPAVTAAANTIQQESSLLQSDVTNNSNNSVVLQKPTSLNNVSLTNNINKNTVTTKSSSIEINRSNPSSNYPVTRSYSRKFKK